ncbi:MAG: beta-lactamase family protein [Actinomycetota bacterium]|nr:beta-lactamase family protein [Actinomycetota bacterium]
MKELGTEGFGSWIDQRAAQHLFSGVVVVWKSGAPVYSRAAGLAHRGHRVPVTIDTRFQVASVTKMVTATTALRLVERGTLKLDRPLVDFLPPEYRPAALDKGHTLHHLLSHTSGLANYHDDEDETWASFTSAWDRVSVYHARGPRDILPLFADLPAVSDPGVFLYGDANFILTGVLIEWVTGKSFATVAEEEVLIPAGMTDSGFFQIDLEPENMATAYLATDEPPVSWRSNVYSVPAGGMPDGGLTTTATDLARLLDAIASGSLLQPDTVTKMLTPHGFDENGVEAYGYGMELVVVEDQVTIYGHGGADPGVSTMVSHFVDADLTVVVLCNQDRGSWATMQKITEILDLPDPRE